MTVAVAGLWDLGYNVPISEAPLWFHPLRDFGITQWHMSPVTGISGYPIQEWNDAEDMFRKLGDAYKIVWVTEAHDDATELMDFIHPRDACYCFGKANWSPFINLAKPGDEVVTLGTKTNLALSFAVNVVFPVLWHRRTQWP